MTQLPLLERIERINSLTAGLEAAWAYWRSIRPLGQQTYRTRANRSHQSRLQNAAGKMEEIRGGSANAGSAVTALSPFGSSPAVSPASPLRSAFADDWDPCPACGFILVACDCDAPKFNMEREHAA